MKKILLALLVGTLLAGCGGDEDTKDRAETESAQSDKIDLDDPEIRAKIIAEAIDHTKIERVGKGPEQIRYDSDTKTPYTGWMKQMSANGQIEELSQLKDGKRNGPWATWWPNGKKRGEPHYINGYKVSSTHWRSSGRKEWEATYSREKWGVMSCASWKPNGEKCPVTGLDEHGNGVWVFYSDNGTGWSRSTYRNHQEVKVECYDGSKLHGWYTEWYENRSRYENRKVIHRRRYEQGKVVEIIVEDGRVVK